MKASEFDFYNIPLEERKAVLLQSGGLDSVYLSHLLDWYDFEVINLFIDYGQNTATKEFECAKLTAEKHSQGFVSVKIDLPWLKDVSLLNGGVAKHYTSDDLNGEVYLAGVTTGIYVPMRNHLFISVASSLAESKKYEYIATGIDGLQDHDGVPLHGTPDKHPNFAINMEWSLNEASALHHLYDRDFELLCPIIGNEKEDTINQGLRLNCDFTDSWTCYNSNTKPCLKCDSCLQRAYAFEQLGLKDPTLEKYYGKYDSVENLLKTKK